MLKSAFRSNLRHRSDHELGSLPSSRRIPARARFGAVGGLVVAAACVLASSRAGFAQTIDENLWITNGRVAAVVRNGGTIYIGGEFTQVGPATGGGVPLDAASGALPASFPKVAGQVYDAVPDGAGGWYVGGSFTAVGGLPRFNLAHVASDLSVSAWDPSASSPVWALAMSGSTIYVGGYFTNVGGQARNAIAALDAMTGAAMPWNPGANYYVRAIAASGSTVYVGGEFTTIGGQPRNFIAALDATTGAATAWNPNASTTVRALAVSGSTIHAGGNFTSIGGQLRNHIAALDAATGAAIPAWDPNANSWVSALAVNGSTVYAGGEFARIGGLMQSRIAAMGDVTTPTLLSLVSARATSDRVELTWHAPAGEVSSATVYRRTARDDWEAMALIWADGTGRLIFQDTQVIAGTRYGYRLGVMEAGQEVVLGETWVEVPVTPQLALAFRSNPTLTDLTVAFSLPDASPARLELFDVGGRRLAAHEVGTLGAGNHVITLGDGWTGAPGIYLLRLSQGARSLTARAAILR